jgi:hypothetical protein
MIEYVHRGNKGYGLSDYYSKEDRIKIGKEKYLIVKEGLNKNSVKRAVVKGKINRWKIKKEFGNRGDYVSEIEFLSRLIRDDKKYQKVRDELEEIINKRYKVIAIFC